MTTTCDGPPFDDAADPTVMDEVLDELSSVSTDRPRGGDKRGRGPDRCDAEQVVVAAKRVHQSGGPRSVGHERRSLVVLALRTRPGDRPGAPPGRLSYSKVRAITRVATTADERDWVDLAVRLPASRLVKLTGQYRTVARDEERQSSSSQSLTWYWDDDGCWWVSSGWPRPRGRSSWQLSGSNKRRIVHSLWIPRKRKRFRCQRRAPRFGWLTRSCNSSKDQGRTRRPKASWRAVTPR